jgi:hypothetical protein
MAEKKHTGSEITSRPLKADKTVADIVWELCLFYLDRKI